MEKKRNPNQTIEAESILKPLINKDPMSLANRTGFSFNPNRSALSSHRKMVPMT